MKTPEQFANAIFNYIEIHGQLDAYGCQELRSCREDILNLRNSFIKCFGFTLLDTEIYLIWSWHSMDWDASFLIPDTYSILYFEEFVERFEK